MGYCASLAKLDTDSADSLGQRNHDVWLARAGEAAQSDQNRTN